jgi:endonuclease/exonuclease/phosphatase family metal-dependent hydrolase
MQQLSANDRQPVILLGDMNDSQKMQGFEAEAGTDAIAELIGPADSGLTLATAALADSGAFSFGGYWRTAHRTLIDHVVVNDTMKPFIQDIHIFTGDIASIASDHYPVIVRITLP